MNVSIFNYTNYREYLKDHFEFSKKQDSKYSYRFFANKAGISSPSQLSLIIKGDRGLTHESLQKFCKGLELRGLNRSYFKELVEFNQAKSLDDKEKAYKKLVKIRNSSNRKKLNSDEQEGLYSKWYYIPLMELSLLKDFKEEPLWISKKLGRVITEEEAKFALEFLIKKEFLIHNEKGQLQPCYKVWRSEDEKTDFHIRSFQYKMLEIAQKKINQPLSDREWRSLTIAMSEEQFQQAKIRIKDFVRNLNEEFTNGEDKSKVAQVNIQLFSLNE